MAGDLIDEPRAWYNDTNGQHLRTRPTNSPSDPLNVFIVSANGATPVLEYNGISSLSSGALTTILSYTVPAGKTLQLFKIEVSGGNTAKYQVEINSVVKGVRRTYWGKFNADFEFNNHQVGEGVVVRVRVIHSRPQVSDFDATLIGALL